MQKVPFLWWLPDSIRRTNLKESKKTMHAKCDTCDQLFEEVEKHLFHISEVSREQAIALANNKMEYASRLDKELEHAMSAKERSLGALKQHLSEHGE
jgi:hypothetical protein